MHFFNALFGALLSTTISINIPNSLNNGNITNETVYESSDEFYEVSNNESESSTFALPGYTPVAPETTSFSDAYPLAGDGAYYAEEFTANDTYDFVKYTANYTRVVFLYVTTSNNCRADIVAYNSRIGLSTQYGWYSVNTDDVSFFYIPVRQGETIYFKVKCYQTCTWEGTLELEFNMSGRCYYTYENLHGYDLPHTGPAEIPYRFHSGVNAYVPGQNYTFKEVFLEAMDIWEACGNITFVENIWTKNYKLEVADVTSVQAGIDETLLGEIYFTHCRIPNDVDYYTNLISVHTNPDGTPVTIRQAILGICLQALGLYLGLGTSDLACYYYNIMYYDPMPYNYLGDGDISSFMYLWGDANKN